MLNAGRQAMIFLGLDDRYLDAGIAGAKRKLRQFWGFMNKPIGGNKKGMGALGAGFVGGLAAGAATGAISKVGGFISDTADSIIDSERALTRLKIAGRSSNAEMEEFRAKLRGVSLETGVARGRIIEGAHAYVALTGDAKGAREQIALFGKVAAASGAEMGDIATTAAALRTNLQIDPKDFQRAFDILITQGKDGAIELNDLARIAAEVAPSFAKFKGGTGIAGLQQMSAALQVARGGFSTAEEAATGLRGMVVSLTKHASQFRERGIRIFEKGDPNQMRSFMDIVDDIKKAKIGSTDLQKLFGRDEGKRFYDMIIGKQTDYNRLVSEGGGDAVNKDAAEYLANSAGKIELAMNAAKEAIIAAFTPERIAAFADSLGKVAEKFSQIVGFVSWLGGEKTKGEKSDTKYEQKYLDVQARKSALLERKYGSRFGPAGDEIAEGYRQGMFHTDPATWSDLQRRTFRENVSAEEERAAQQQLHGEEIVRRGVERAPQAFSVSGLVDLAKTWGPATSDPKLFANILGKAIGENMLKQIQAQNLGIGVSVDGRQVAVAVAESKGGRNHTGGKHR